MNDKILVCGAGGFVGGKLVEYLVRNGYKNIRAVSSRPVSRWLRCFGEAENVQADLRDPAQCERVTADARWIYNLAAKVGGIHYIGGNKADCFLSALINMNLLRAITGKSVAGYFFASSACVYGDAPKGEPIHEDVPLVPSPGYGEEKIFSEKVCQALAHEHQIPVRIARYHTVYGPGDDIKGAEGRDHAQSALCRKVIKAKVDGPLEINIWGDGEQTRSFLFIDDCVEGTVRLMHSGANADPVNMANSEVATVNDMVTMLEDIAAVKLTRFYQPGSPTGVQHRRSDNSRIREKLQWEPMTPLKEGLRKLYNDLFWKIVHK